MLTACASDKKPKSEPDGMPEEIVRTDVPAEPIDIPEPAPETEPAQPSEIIPEAEPVQPQEWSFRDVHGKEYTVELHGDWPMQPYDSTLFQHDGYYVNYEDEVYISRCGVDVSSYQKSVDWQAVAAAGYSFAIVRIGFRGYGAAGTLKEDRYATANIHGAMEQGLDVGVYLFAQAVSEAEAVEEAEFVLAILAREGITPENLALPIVYDPETIDKETARTKDVTGEQLTKNALAFCKTIREAGYQPMVYSNMLWEAYNLDLGALAGEEIPIWYADYEEIPQTPYAYVMWQYSERARVPGIRGGVDTDIQLIPRKQITIE